MSYAGEHGSTVVFQACILTFIFDYMAQLLTGNPEPGSSMFEAVFTALPGNSILVATDAPLYTIIAVTEGMMHQSGLSKKALLNKPFFGPFPANPLNAADPNALGQHLVYESFEFVLKNKAAHSLNTMRYDLQNEGGGFTEHYWNIHNKPVEDSNGNVLYILHTSEEITARIKAEKREEEIKGIEKAHELFMQAPAVVAIFKGKENIIELANDAALELLQSDTDIIGKPLHTALPQLSNHGLPALLNQVRKTGNPFFATQVQAISLQNENREPRFFDVILKPCYTREDADGGGVFALAHEVTEMMVAKGKLAESEIKYRTLFETMDQGFCIIGMIFDEKGVPVDYRFLEVNPVFEHHTGLKDAVGRTAKELVPDLEPHWFEMYGAVATTGEPVRFDERSDAMGRWFEVYAFKIGDNAGNKVALLFTDITERKLAGDAISQSEKKLRNIIMQSPVAMCILTGPSFIVEVANDSVLALWGKTREEIMDRPMFEARPEAREQGLEQLLQQVYTSGQRYSASEHPVNLPRNGAFETMYINFVYEPFTGLDGNIAGVMAVASDVTSQVKARKKIEENEEKLRIAIEGGELGTYDYFPATGELQWSDKTKEHFGLPPGKPVNVMDFLKGVHLGDSESTRLAFEAALSKTNKGRYENEYRTVGITDGRVRYIRSKGKISFDSNGKPIRLTGVTQDITRQKEAEERLRYAATLTANIADAIIGTDMNYKITRWNKGAENLYGHTEEEVLGKLAGKVIPTQYLSEEDRHAWQHALDTIGHWQGEVLQQTKNGTFVYVLASLAYVKDGQGNIIGAVAVNKNNTDSKNAQERIKESEEKFRTLTETLPQLVWMTDEKGVQEYASRRWEEYTGVEPEDEYSWSEIVHPDDLRNISLAWTNSMATGASYYAEARLKNRDGSYRWHFVQGEPIRNSEGKILKWIGSFTDIDDQKTLSQKLEKLVAERTKALERSNEDLQQFAHVASHDLKEPVRKIRIFSNLLEGEFETVLPPKALNLVRKIDTASGRMYDMIDGVLLYSSFDAIKHVKQTVDLNQILKDILIDLEIVIHQKEATIDLQVLPQVEGSPVLLHQLFYNLVNNSLKFLRSGIKPLIQLCSRELPAAEARSYGLPAGEYTAITISDNGIGFDQAFAGNIFKTFSRLHTKDKYEGTGLGLALCKRIAERHGGLIRAEGRENEGAVFTIVLPLK